MSLRKKFDGEKFDVLLINGSSHRGHNTGVLVDSAEKALQRKGVSLRRFNLNELDIQQVIVASPINWNNMSARLKDFLDRLTCLQNL